MFREIFVPHVTLNIMYAKEDHLEDTFLLPSLFLSY
jgi:hypothetical protein